MGCPQLDRHGEALGHDVDGDDPCRGRQLGRHDCREPNATGAEHHHGVTEAGVEHLQHRRGAGLKAADQRGEHRQRGIDRHLDRRRGTHDGTGGERGLPEEVRVQRGAIGETHRRRTVHPEPAGEIARHPCVALHRPTGHTLGAFAAGVERHHHVLALGEGRHIAPDPLHDTGTLMAQQRGMRERQPTVLCGRVGVADTRGDKSNDNLVIARVVDD